MPKWWYYGMCYPFLFLGLFFGMMQFINGNPWGFVASGFSLTGVYFLKRFIKLNRAAPEE